MYICVRPALGHCGCDITAAIKCSSKQHQQAEYITIVALSTLNRSLSENSLLVRKLAPKNTKMGLKIRFKENSGAKLNF